MFNSEHTENTKKFCAFGKYLYVFNVFHALLVVKDIVNK